MTHTASTGQVAVQRSGALVRLTLCHAGKFNAMSRAMWLQLKTVFLDIQADASVRCVVVAGAQGHFCAGGDISEYPQFRFDAEQLRQFHAQEVWGALQAILDCDVPIIAQIEGNCMGAGLEIASCCDVRMATHAAKFGAPIARLGFPMAPREAALVAQATGTTMARAILLAAEVFEAADMLRCGFLTRVLAPEVLALQVQKMAERITHLAPLAARMNKQTLRTLAPQMPPEAADPYAYANSPEHREGITAFIEKRKPHF